MKSIIRIFKHKISFGMIIPCILIIGFTLLSTSLSAQVSINTTGNAPDGSAMLDVVSSNKGVLMPRVALTGTSSASPITSPATGLMVYNTATTGDVTPGYYWWDSSEWVRFGSGGGCTLDQAYDFGGAGAGRTITADNGAVEINNGSNAAHFINASDVANFTNGSDVVSVVRTGDEVVSITTSSKDMALNLSNSSSSSHTLHAENSSNSANTIYAENTNTSNIGNAIEGVSNYGSTTAGNYPAGVGGYFSGSGMGVGVWGQSTGSGSSAGAGVFGTTSNNNFGVRGHANNYAGIYASTNNAGAQAIQMASSGASALNPAMLAVGYVDFTCSNSASTTIKFNNLAGEPTISTVTAGYGYLGTAGYPWYYLYYMNATQISRRETKRDITYLESANYELVMKDIDAMKPAFYKYNIETDVLVEGNESKYRPNMHLGVILDETPDYIQDNAFSGIDVYAIATLSLAGVKYNRAEIQKLKEKISDFGIVKMESNETWVSFDDDFTSKLKSNDLPTVVLTTNSADAKVYISEQDNSGFKIQVADGTDNLIINWIAMAKVSAETSKTNFENEISPELYKQLVVPEDIKKQAQEKLINTEEQKSLKLLGDEDPNIKATTKRIDIDE